MQRLILTLSFLILMPLFMGQTDLQAQESVDSRISGAWFDVTHSGEGFIIEVLNDGRAVVYWFTYDDLGRQRWFIGVGQVEGDQLVFDELLAASGGIFGEEFDPDNVVLSDAGDLIITINNCTQAQASYTVDGVTGSQQLDRLSELIGLECFTSSSLASASSGTWFDNTHSGEGLVIEILSDGRALVYWFSFDSDGNPAWFFGIGSQIENRIEIEEMLITSGGVFGNNFDPDQVIFEPWGSMVVELDCDFGKLDYQSLIDSYGTGKQTLNHLTVLGSPECEEAPAPNILLVIADDLGLDASNQYQISENLPATPVLDELAQQGLIFDNAWSYPTCSPTRSSILTGKFGARTGVLDASDVLSTDEMSLQTYIHDHLPGKYTDAVIGKWHLGPNRDPNHPLDMGVSEFSGVISGGVEAYDNWQFTHEGEQSQETQYTSSKFVDLAIDWVDQQENPWFLWLAFNAPHTPFHLPPADLHDRNLSGSEQDIEDNPLPYYLAAIEAFDTELGRLLDSMPEDERANTIVIFIGDNGTPGQVAQTPFSRMKAKGSLYQGGVNIPMFVSGPAVTRTGLRESGLINTTDLFATIAALAGVNVSQVNDSTSFANLLSDDTATGRTFQFSERMNDEFDQKTYSDGQYKLIESATGEQELYDLLSDPYENLELINNATDPAGKVDELHEKILDLIETD